MHAIVCFFCQIYCFSPKINVHSYNSLCTFNVCIAAAVTKVCVNSSSGDVLHFKRSLVRFNEKKRETQARESEPVETFRGESPLRVPVCFTRLCVEM